MDDFTEEDQRIQEREIVAMAPIHRPVFRFLSTFFILILIGLGLFKYMQTQRQSLHEYRITRFYMDTYVEITINAPAGDKDRVNKAMDKAFQVFETLDKQLSFQDPESYLSQVNSGTDVSLQNPDMETVLLKGFEFARDTDGLFDPTLGSLKMIYPIGKENPAPPDEHSIATALLNAGYTKVTLSRGRLKKPREVLMDLGGILKGYAVEEAAMVLQRAGFDNFIVNGGGNVSARGKNFRGEDWKIALEHPRVHGEIVAVIPLEGCAVATSGDYQRYFFYNGVRYHHIIDPATGKPARQAISAMVIAPDAMMADAYSTAAFIMGRDKGIPFLERRHLEGIIMDENGYSITSGLKKSVTVNYKGKK